MQRYSMSPGIAASAAWIVCNGLAALYQSAPDRVKNLIDLVLLLSAFSDYYSFGCHPKRHC